MFYNSLKDELSDSCFIMMGNAEYAEEPLETPNDSAMFTSNEINFTKTTVVGQPDSEYNELLASPSESAIFNSKENIVSETTVVGQAENAEYAESMATSGDSTVLSSEEVDAIESFSSLAFPTFAFSCLRRCHSFKVLRLAITYLNS